MIRPEWQFIVFFVFFLHIIIKLLHHSNILIDTGSWANAKRERTDFIFGFLFTCIYIWWGFNEGLRGTYPRLVEKQCTMQGGFPLTAALTLKCLNAPAHSNQVLPLHRHVPRAAFLGVRAHRHREVRFGKRTAAPGAAVRSAPPPPDAEPEARWSGKPSLPLCVICTTFSRPFKNTAHLKIRMHLSIKLP